MIKKQHYNLSVASNQEKLFEILNAFKNINKAPVKTNEIAVFTENGSSATSKTIRFFVSLGFLKEEVRGSYSLTKIGDNFVQLLLYENKIEISKVLSEVLPKQPVTREIMQYLNQVKEKEKNQLVEKIMILLNITNIELKRGIKTLIELMKTAGIIKESSNGYISISDNSKTLFNHIIKDTKIFESNERDNKTNEKNEVTLVEKINENPSLSIKRSKNLNHNLPFTDVKKLKDIVKSLWLQNSKGNDSSPDQISNLIGISSGVISKQYGFLTEIGVLGKFGKGNYNLTPNGEKYGKLLYYNDENNSFSVLKELLLQHSIVTWIISYLQYQGETKNDELVKKVAQANNIPNNRYDLLKGISSVLYLMIDAKLIAETSPGNLNIVSNEISAFYDYKIENTENKELDNITHRTNQTLITEEEYSASDQKISSEYKEIKFKQIFIRIPKKNIEPAIAQAKMLLDLLLEETRNQI